MNIAKKLQRTDKIIERKMRSALRRNVKRRKGKYATARDQELMFGY